MYKIIFSIGLLFLFGKIYAVSGNFSEPYQIGIAVENEQPCFYLHGNVAVYNVGIYSPYVKGIVENQGYNYIGGFLSPENQKTGYDVQHCIIVDEVKFVLDIPYDVNIWEKERPSSFFAHSEKFCIRKRKRDNQLYISEVKYNQDNSGLICSEKPLSVKYQPKPNPQFEPNWWEKIWYWFFDLFNK